MALGEMVRKARRKATEAAIVKLEDFKVSGGEVNKQPLKEKWCVETHFKEDTERRNQK